MRRLAAVALALSLALGGAGCSQEADAPSSPERSTLSQSDERTLMEAAFWLTWADMTHTEKSDICWGWDTHPDVMESALHGSARENGLDARLMADLFKEACEL